MKKINFDVINDRYGSFCTQWDYVKDRFGVKGLTPFTISDTDFNVPDEIIETIEERTKHHIFGYSRWNHDEFKNSVVKWYKERFDTKIDKDFVVYSPSVTFSIAKLIEILTEEGDGILVQTPYYDAFLRTIEAIDRRFIRAELNLINDRFEMDFQHMERKIIEEEVKVFLLCNPHNPTGRVWKGDELKKIVEICKKYHVFVISDDIHMDIVYNNNMVEPIIKVAQDYKEKVAIVTSATKTFNTPSLAYSYIVIPNEDIKDKFLFALKDKNGLSSPSIYGMLTTITAYEKCGYWVDELNNYLEENLKYIEKELNNLEGINLIKPEGTYLALLKLSKDKYTEEEFIKKLIENGVAIMGGSVYGLKNSLRLNFGAPRKKIEIAIEAIKKSL